MTLADSLRFFDLCLHVYALALSLRAAAHYGPQALANGWKAAWRDLINVRIERFLPIHVSVVSLMLSGYIAMASTDLLLRWGDELTWRAVVSLPLGLGASFALTLIAIFVSHSGKRVVQVDGNGLVDRANRHERQTDTDRRKEN